MKSFSVPGIPVTKGSAKSFYNPKTKRIVTMQDNAARQKPWASMISFCAQERGFSIINDGPVGIVIEFTMPRPKSHYGTGRKAGVLKPTAPVYHASRGDIDKLERCVLDALTGIVWRDDRQVCRVIKRKVYGDNPGANITIFDLRTV